VHNKNSKLDNIQYEAPHLYLAPPLGVMSLEFHRDFWHRMALFM